MPPAPKQDPQAVAEPSAPQPDNAASVRAALASSELRELLSTSASDAFLRWLEGNGDESWRGEFE